ncbi:hypothetical protein CMI39_03365 [Candidatus Pacearchaeota archaeon]|jgi:mRNA interferase MazF|nr:hypothetical protein [Candidatus Pacearchaeota archaeon]|tara:strand:+ start:4045 stop:4371 length:327 start_codon:yes stop_codon:yes gene_type:complete
MKKGEVWILELPSKRGKEQKGIRPGIIIANTKTNMIVTLPLTSNLQALRFPNTLKIKTSKENNLEKDSIALIFQIQSLDKKRFLAKIGIIENKYMTKINNIIKEMFEY